MTSVIKNSLVSGQVPAVSTMALTDIAVNNADGALYIVKVTGNTKSMVQVGGITSFNTRTGDIVLNSSDVTTALGYTPIGTNSPAFTGNPSAPTATYGASSTQLATTAFVQAALTGFTVPTPSIALTGLTDVAVTDTVGNDGTFLSFSANQTKWIAVKPAKVALTGAYGDLSGAPILSAIATSGLYSDLSGVPTPYSLPIATSSSLGGVRGSSSVNIGSDGTMTVPLISTLAGLSDVNLVEGPSIDGDALIFDNTSNHWVAKAISTVGFTGKYSDLIGAPSIGSTITADQFLAKQGVGASGQAYTTGYSFQTEALGDTGMFSLGEGSLSFYSNGTSLIDMSVANGVTINSAFNFTGQTTSVTPTAGDNSTKLATTAYVTAALAALSGVTTFNGRSGDVTLTASDITSVGGALLASPVLTGNPTAPTPATGDSSLSIATTAFVANQISSISTGVTSFNTRSGGVTLIYQDVVNALGYTPQNNANMNTYAPLASPLFTGTPFAPTVSDSTNASDQIATTAFVQSVVNAGTVSSWNGRGGVVTMGAQDVRTALGFTPANIASPTFTGTPAAPTPTIGDNSTNIATTAFVASAVSTSAPNLSSYAPLASPALTGTPIAPTAAAGTNTTQLATTAFVKSAVTTGVTGLASLASPTFTGTPAAPTATAGTSTTQVATTAFVTAAISSIPAGGVTSFNTRTGAITFTSSDITAASGALLASPTFTGTPAAPTASGGTNTTQLATTAFVNNAVVGLASLASPALTGTPTAPTASGGTSTTQLATTAFVTNAVTAIKYYDVTAGAAGNITSSQLLGLHIAVRTLTFPNAFAGSQGYAMVAPTASTTIAVALNGTIVGTVVFAAGSKTSTFTTVSNTGFTMTPGQYLTFTSASSVDTTFANLAITILSTAT